MTSDLFGLEQQEPRKAAAIALRGGARALQIDDADVIDAPMLATAAQARASLLIEQKGNRK